ncbi:hypothetical protein EDC04DRAFT_2611980 [Pisolithus marmoratus]|nr:hypothetical protein EDC04DRAFT_2611980 [Pisolithus marmoratus]
MVEFFNDVLGAVVKVIGEFNVQQDLDWRDVIVFGEMKNKMSTNMLRKSYIEAAGKTTLLFYAQDRRHSAPCLQILDFHVILTFFDQGGSLLTVAFDIHNNPDIFLCILLGISTALIETIGFDETVFWDHDHKRKKIHLHGHGTTIWAGSVKDPTSPMTRRQIVIKDSWIDPLQKFTEGRLLAKLNDANVKVHKDAISKAKVLHCNISILNLLLVPWDASQDDSCHSDFLDHLLPETCKHLQAKIWEIPHRGFLTDWGYAVLLNILQTDGYNTPELEGASTTPSTPHHDVLLTSPISPSNNSTSSDKLVPVQIPVLNEGMDQIAYISLSELKDDHEIVLLMGRDPLPDWPQPLVDTNPLYCTISSMQEMTKGGN